MAPHNLVGLGIALSMISAIAGCALDSNVSSAGYHLAPLADQQFAFHVREDRLAEVGGLKSIGLARLMEQELARKGICPKGYTVISETGGRGTYDIFGRCK
jgi:hypothetical protein